jgi:hypothetical protein
MYGIKQAYTAISFFNWILFSEFFNGIVKNIDAATHTFSWNLDVVVDKMLQTIQQREMPAQLLIGIDGQFLYILTRMLPSWVTSFRPSWVAKIVPQIMKKESSRTVVA